MANGWSLIPLGDILTERREIPSLESIETGEISIISKIGFREGKIELRNETKTKTGMILIRPGDLVISGINAVKGAIAIYDSSAHKTIAATIHYGAYIPNKERLDIRFLWWFLRSAVFRDMVQEYIPGGIKTELKAKRFLEVPVPLPPLTEQRRIVERIEALAERVDEAQSLRQYVGEEAEAIFASAITNLPFNESQWKNVDFALSRSKGAIHSGPFGSDLTHGEFVESGIAAIGTRDVKVNKFSLGSGWYVTPERFERLKQYQIYPGDVLVTIIGGSIGRFCVVPTDVPLAFTTKHVIAMQFNPSIADRQFMSYMLNFHARCRETMFSQTSGSAQPSLNISKIKAIEIPVPPLEEQRRLVAYLDELQTQVAKVRGLQEESARELEAMMPSILDNSLKGSTLTNQ